MTVNVIVDLGPALQKLGDKFVATLAEFNSRFDTFDDKLKEIAAEIADLKAKISAGGMSADEENEALAKFDARIAALDAAK